MLVSAVARLFHVRGRALGVQADGWRKERSSNHALQRRQPACQGASIDDSGVFVGSCNLGPRSTFLNSEQGIFVRSTGLAGSFSQLFDQLVSRRWTREVSLESCRLQWDDGQTTRDKATDASLFRRFMAGLTRILPTEPQL